MSFTSFQQDVDAWVLSTFGADNAADRNERLQRFLEEALELCQAAGLSRDTADNMTEYVFARPKGEISQELGGTLTTLAALSNCLSLNLSDEGKTELARCWQKQDLIRLKQKGKPKL